MKIGISFLPLGSAFSSGGAQVAVHLAELLQILGHEITLLSMSPGRTWFDDCTALPGLAGFKCLDASNADVVLQDLLIDTLGCMTRQSRNTWGRRSVVFVYKMPVLADQEGSIYGMNTFIMNYEGVSEVWTWRGMDQGELEYLGTLSRLPVRELPFVWFPTLVELYKKEAGLGDWCSGSGSDSGSDKCHIMETNTKVSSSCHVPLMICQHARQVGVSVHCSEHIVDGKYFSENFKKYLQIEDVKWVGRQRVADLLREEGSFVLSHMRFRALRPLLLDCVWLGIPTVHNSTWLRDFGHGYERLYYESNSISGGAEAIGRVGSWQRGVGVQDALLKSVSILGESDVSLYIDALNSAPQPTSRNDELVIQFMDFWEGFQANYNFFILLLQEELRSAGRGTRVLGVGEEWRGRADLIIFGPYTQKWREAAADIPKVYFSGEWDDGPGVESSDVFLNLGFPLQESEKYIRLPLWVLYINWFGADSQRLVNPTLLELEEVTSVEKAPRWADREKFCAFVVSNPRCDERNAAFKELNTWRGVDAAGALFNNVGYRLEGGPGGGGGERAKLDFYKDYKFVLCYENRLMPGYTTEKLLHAKAAGCVPIYWGDGEDFDESGFLNMTGRSESVWETVKDSWGCGEAEKMAGVPALSAEKVVWCRQLLTRVAKKILGKIYGDGDGHEVNTQPAPVVAAVAAAAAAAAADFRKIVLVTSASRETERDVVLWLESVEEIKQRLPEARVLIRWTGAEPLSSYVLEKYPWISAIIPAETSACVDVCQWLSESEEALILHVPVSLAINSLPVELIAAVLAGDGGTYIIEGTEVLCFKGARNMASLLRGRRIVSAASCSHNFKEHAQQFCRGIDKCSLINLKRRPDRLERFYQSHPSIKERQVEIVEAFDGSRLTLGPHLVRLFFNNNFGWKKGAIGCNLSHLALWKKLAEGHETSTLILEDDVKFKSESWITILERSMKDAPKDYDILYLGGLLPPNIEGWCNIKEPVNKYWCRIGMNKHFGQVDASRFYHFCTYSYIISKSGAKKLLSIINNKEGSYKNVVDHQILHSWPDLNIYVSDPLLAGCYQDDDPRYKASNFNDVARADVFDSDIWTSRDCFILDGQTQVSVQLDIGAALQEAIKCNFTPPIEKYQIACFSEELSNIFEGQWLADIFGTETAFRDVKVIHPDMGEIYENSIIAYQGRDKRQVEAMMIYLDELEARGWSCGLIHLSDEFSADDIAFYGRRGVRWVVRNYWRDGLTAKVKVIPLGFHRKPLKSNPLTERPLAWSFHGTIWDRWPGRQHMIDVLKEIKPHRSYVRAAWEEPMSEESVMLGDMGDSWIIPCPEGNNTESFRIYEALEAGALPLLVDERRGPWSNHFYLWLQRALPSICILQCWEDAEDIFRRARDTPVEFEQRRDRLLGEWGRWKNRLRTELQDLLMESAAAPSPSAN
jgi:GR25 family glycosyltransferase involved in LPS biosynthesis